MTLSSSLAIRHQMNGWIPHLHLHTTSSCTESHFPIQKSLKMTSRTSSSVVVAWPVTFAIWRSALLKASAPKTQSLERCSSTYFVRNFRQLTRWRRCRSLVSIGLSVNESSQLKRNGQKMCIHILRKWHDFWNRAKNSSCRTTYHKLRQFRI